MRIIGVEYGYDIRVKNMIGNKLIGFLIKIVPERLKFEQDIPGGYTILQWALAVSIIRRWLAEWLTEKIIRSYTRSGEDVILASSLDRWLNSLAQVQYTDLRRLTLALFLNWSTVDNYYGQDFTTKPNYNDAYYDKRALFEGTVICAIYPRLIK